MKQTTVQIVQHLRPGGIEVLCLNMLKHSQYPMVLIALEGDKASALNAWPALIPYSEQLIFLDKPPRFSWTTVMYLRQYLKQIEPRAIHTHHIGPLLYSSLATILMPYPHIHTEHDAWHLDDSKQRWITKTLLFRPIKLVADASSVARDIKRKLNSRLPTVIRNGIDTDYFRPGDKCEARDAHRLPATPFIIGFAGRLVKEKSLHTLLHALSGLPSSMILAVAGDGPMKAQWQAEAREMGVAHRIIWLGHINNMVTFYQALDLFCLPSSNEGLPLSILEAQSCGCSVVASHVGAIHELLNPDTGKLFQSDNSLQLTEHIKILSTEITQDTATKNHRYIVRHANIKNMLHLYEQLIV